MNIARYLLLGGIVLGIAAPAFAGIPDPDLSSANTVIISPFGDIEYVVQVNESSGPVQGALVELVFTVEGDSLLCWCEGQTRGTITAISDVDGRASFFIAGGGCLDATLLSVPPVEVRADGIVIDQVGVVSADAVDDFGLVPTDPGYDPEGLCEVGISDSSFHTPPFTLSIYSFCSDLSGDGLVDIVDVSLATPGIKAGHACTSQ